ncbi:hypothetical protein [Streptomyces mangrovisoli]|uniref:Uncharacterized protein n=1 Tax=Streptomyces mangrovisoli TaxID=1428628 RepID=A0A1J4NW82_9ACTN|nr:hypothetical protein [Streptomyces mangrovisoli]OIJ66346.1 hypothetical protein WN71_018685 [Streptomyces mangrovisoli]
MTTSGFDPEQGAQDGPPPPRQPAPPPYTAPGTGYEQALSAPIPAPPQTPPYGIPSPSYGVPDGSLDPLPIPTAAGRGGAAAASDSVLIGLWGAPRAGKTTYLAALPVAAMQQQRQGSANWVVVGMSQDANDFLIENVTRLTSERRFPVPTLAPVGMSWSFTGTERGALRPRGRDVSFVLEIQDFSGESFWKKDTRSVDPAAVDHLARSQGIIYLFDPLLDAEEHTRSLDYFYATLTQLAARVRDEGRFHRNRLPHHVSVCVTKFDHPSVFRPSVEARWVTQEQTGSRIPRIPDNLGNAYFDWVCDDFRGATARLVRDGLRNFFHEDRISYYASSAIGFRLNPQNIFDYRNYANVEMVDGEPRICTPPIPINVIEPLVDLERKIRTDRRRRWRRP